MEYVERHGRANINFFLNFKEVVNDLTERLRARLIERYGKLEHDWWR
jgi:hypothetical protein